jgi:hypothetical protein
MERALNNPIIIEAIEKAESIVSQSKRGIERIAQHGRGLSELSAAFLCRMLDISNIAVGVVMPSSLRRNKTQVWLRKRLIDQSEGPRLVKLAGYINRYRLFSDLPPIIQYDLVVARPSLGDNIKVGFSIEKFETLFEGELPIEYPVEAIKRLNPSQYSIAEISDSKSADAVATILINASNRANSVFNQSGISLSQEVNQRTLMMYCVDISSFGDPRTPALTNFLNLKHIIPLLESKSIYQCTSNWPGSARSTWNPIPKHGISLTQSQRVAIDKVNQVRHGAVYFRLCFRETCGSPHTNERSVVGSVVPPGISAFNSAIIEQHPYRVANSFRLVALAINNSFPFDFIARPQIGAHLSLFILEGLPWPDLNKAIQRFLAHSSLRLTCNHEGYTHLWKDQVGDTWREENSIISWPVLGSDDARWAVRAAIDAVVAEAFGLDRDQYAHVLSTFTHRSYPKAPELCLAAFDDLKATGLEAFTQKHDPYWDIPLNESLPQPVIDLPIPGQEASDSEDFGPIFADLQGASAPAPAPRPAPLPMAPRPPRTEANQAYDTLKALLQERGDISSGDAQEATGLDAGGVRPLLRRLVEEGLAETEGQRRGMRYRRRGGG